MIMQLFALRLRLMEAKMTTLQYFLGAVKHDSCSTRVESAIYTRGTDV